MKITKDIYIVAGSLALTAFATYFLVKFIKRKKNISMEKTENNTEDSSGIKSGNFPFTGTGKPGTKHFSIDEFNCNDGTPVPPEYYGNVQTLMNQLEIIREAIGGYPMDMHSGYRTDKHNKEVGGKPNSEHLVAKAGDTSSLFVSPAKIKQVIEDLIKQGKIMEGGVGLYPTFVHYDVRGTKARW